MVFSPSDNRKVKIALPCPSALAKALKPGKHHERLHHERATAHPLGVPQKAFQCGTAALMLRVFTSGVAAFNGRGPGRHISIKESAFARV
jgi:hypothetical protein